VKPYTFTVDDAVLQVFATASERHRIELLRIFDYLAGHPFVTGESTQPDQTGRHCQVKRFGPWTIGRSI
jgi:2-oxo-4-hydroxy-4-carboxy--5-ureidoimidazoline (OHCU) decarboxylase